MRRHADERIGDGQDSGAQRNTPASHASRRAGPVESSMVVADVFGRLPIDAESTAHVRAVPGVSSQQGPFFACQRAPLGEHGLGNDELAEVVHQPRQPYAFDRTGVHADERSDPRRQLTDVGGMAGQVFVLRRAEPIGREPQHSGQPMLGSPLPGNIRTVSRILEHGHLRRAHAVRPGPPRQAERPIAVEHELTRQDAPWFSGHADADGHADGHALAGPPRRFDPPADVFGVTDRLGMGGGRLDHAEPAGAPSTGHVSWPLTDSQDPRHGVKCRAAERHPTRVVEVLEPVQIEHDQ